jgi:hydrogenase maturation protease
VSDPRTLIQCIGNRLGRDDGAGPAVADRLRRQSLPARTDICKHWGEGSQLMQEWDRAERVILVDAAASGAPPGTIHRFDARAQAIPKGFCCYSTHRFGVAEAVELARVLGRLPKEIRLYAIEGTDFGNGEGLSPAVAEAVENLSADIFKHLSDNH